MLFTNKNTRPIMTIPVRTIAPIIRENNLSKAARNFSPIVSFTPLAADICLNGANKVFNKIPMEKKSDVLNKLVFANCSLFAQPTPYHH